MDEFEEFPEKKMTCSYDFSLWLLEQNHRDGHDGDGWLDVILRYCNPSYPQVIREEIRKGNDMYYDLSWNREKRTCIIRPSYRLAVLHADDVADERHIYDAEKAGYGDVCGYSVLTTGACFPGFQQGEHDFSVYPSLSNYTENDESRWQFAVTLMTVEEFRMLKDRSLTAAPYISYDRFTPTDTYDFEEFVISAEKGFKDSYPGIGGRSCADKEISYKAQNNILKHLICDCARMCCAFGIVRTHQILYYAVLATYVLKHNPGMRNGVSVDSVIDAADRCFESVVKKYPELVMDKPVQDYGALGLPEIMMTREEEDDTWNKGNGDDEDPDFIRDVIYDRYMSAEDRIYFFMVSGFRIAVADPPDDIGSYIHDIRNAAIDNRENAFMEYHHPALDWADFIDDEDDQE